jgi:hypothetical protein
MFGKLVKYVVAKGMKLLPNFIGRTSAQAQTDVVSEGFTLGNVITSVSGEEAEAANDGKVIEQTPAVTTAADYETPVDLTVRQFTFTPFGVFGFSPFQVFGFSPFNVFGFSPFSVFGFSPFRVFGFSPFTVFGFSPICIDEDSLVLTTNGYKKAKEITDSDTFIVSTFDEIPMANINTILQWKSKSLTNVKNIESKVTYIKVNQVENTTVYNDDIQNRISNTEEILILRNNEYIMERTDSVVLGDKIVKIVDGKEIHEIVNKVDSIKEKRNVYEFGREVFGLLDINGVLVYHLYPID